MKLDKKWQNSPNCVKRVWRVCESVWRSVWNCLKGLPMSFPAHVHAFRHPTYWNWTKNGKIALSVWKVCEECVRGFWRSMWNCVKVSPMIFPARIYASRHLQCQNWLKNGLNSPKCVKGVWSVCEYVWRSVWNCVKVSPVGSPAQVHAFRHPNCWNWLKNGQYSPKCVKSVWRVCESV